MFELSFETENFTWKFRNFLRKFFDLLLPNQIELFIMKIVITSSNIPFIFFLNVQWAIRNFPHETSHSSINHQSSRLLPTFPQRVPFSLFTIKRFFFLNEDENGKGRKFDGRESFALKENVKNCRKSRKVCWRTLDINLRLGWASGIFLPFALARFGTYFAAFEIFMKLQFPLHCPEGAGRIL